VGVCKRCGSINTRELQSSFVARVVTLLLRRRLVACQRCGWQGRVSVTREPAGTSHSRRRPRPAAFADHVAPHDPNLTAVDAVLATEQPRQPGFGEAADVPRGSR
jgi:hypothetical protein